MLNVFITPFVTSNFRQDSFSYLFCFLLAGKIGFVLLTINMFHQILEYEKNFLLQQLSQIALPSSRGSKQDAYSGYFSLALLISSLIANLGFLYLDYTSFRSFFLADFFLFLLFADIGIYYFIIPNPNFSS